MLNVVMQFVMMMKPLKVAQSIVIQLIALYLVQEKLQKKLQLIKPLLQPHKYNNKHSKLMIQIEHQRLY